jgi:uncharacterized membrane protein
MARVFWVITAACFAFAVHIAYVLFVPGLQFQRKLNAETSGKPNNSFFILDPAQQSKLFPVATGDDVVGLCKFDLGGGSLQLTAHLPKTYWNLAIYTQSGKQVYSLDDVQAGSSTFTIDLSRSKGFLEQLLASGENEDGGQIENLGWKAETTEKRGLAIVWIPLSNALMRDNVEATVRESRCALKAKG